MDKKRGRDFRGRVEKGIAKGGIVKGLTFLLIFIFLSFPSVMAASVSRTITPSSSSPGSFVNVDLFVNLDGGEDFYIIEEKFPGGWNVSSAGVGTITNDGLWRFVENNPSADITHRYTLQVPDGANGIYSFSGEYGIVGTGGNVEAAITGGNSLTISGGSGTIVSVLPASQTAQAGNNFAVDIYVSGAVNLYGLQFDLAYDDNLLDVVSVVENLELLGQNLGAGGGVTDSNDLGAVNLQPGLINDFVVFRTGTFSGVTGNGKVATITFNSSSSSTGSSLLDLSNTILSDPNSAALTHSAVDGTANVGFCGDGTQQSSLGEQCDDGNNVNGDGCSAVCSTNSCVSSGGDVCNADEICSGSSLDSADSDRCCSVACVLPSWPSCGQCGTGTFNICDRNECESLISESCYFVDTGFPGFSGDCSSCAGASCTGYNGDQTSCESNICGFTPSCQFSGGSCQAISSEISCNDGIDNDADGNTDCVDLECAGQIGPSGAVCCQAAADCSSVDGECKITSCQANVCVVTDRAAGDATECGTCGACNVAGGSCAPITAADGNNCNDQCTSCVAGACTPRAVHDFTECIGICAACDGTNLNCVADTFTEGNQCLDPNNYCNNGFCCPDANNDSVCDECSFGIECNDGNPLTDDACVVGACTYTLIGCAAADVNGDNDVSILDLVYIVVNPTDPRSNVDSTAGVAVGDLTFVATRINVCP